jgi:hypothetical protein
MQMGMHRRAAVLGVAVTVAILLPAAVALANHQFSDVPDGSPFHADISAIADAGVTGGCGGGKFCPDENVTREQMAAFMNRLGALAPGKAPVVNAARLQGKSASAFMPLGASAPVGSVQYGSWAVAASQDFPGVTSISFAVPASAVPNVQVVQFGATPTSTCPGSPAAPTAKSGYLCIYVGWNLQQPGYPEPVQFYDPTDGYTGGSRFGTVVHITDSAGDADQVAEASGTWALTTSSTAALSAPDAGTRGAAP